MSSHLQPSRLKRPHHPTPAFVREALVRRNLPDAFHSRPAYQQNDYVGSINRAKLRETKEKRLAQLLDELFRGAVYMKMDYQPRQLKVTH